MSNTKLKPLCLMDIFREMTDEEHRLNVPELVEELQSRGVRAERKGVYRDIEALREYGVDIRHSGGGYYLAEREFTQDELKVMAWAVQAAEFITERRTDELIHKLRRLAGVHGGRQLIRGCSASLKHSDSEQAVILDVLDGAIAQRRQVTFAYRDGAFAGRRFRMSPYAIVFAGRGGCVAGNLEGREDISCIPIAQIQHVRTDMTPWRHFSEVSEYRTEFSAADFAAKLLLPGDINK